MKKIVLVFDSFKGSVGSFEIAKAAEKAIQEELHGPYPDLGNLEKYLKNAGGITRLSDYTFPHS